MKYIRKNKIVFASAGLVLCLGLSTMQALAANDNNGVLQAAGIAQLFENRRSVKTRLKS